MSESKRRLRYRFYAGAVFGALLTIILFSPLPQTFAPSSFLWDAMMLLMLPGAVVSALLGFEGGGNVVTLTVATVLNAVLYGVLALVPAFIGETRQELRRQRRRDQDECACCGYNLIFNRSGICPECGTEVKA